MAFNVLVSSFQDMWDNIFIIFYLLLYFFTISSTHLQKFILESNVTPRNFVWSTCGINSLKSFNFNVEVFFFLPKIIYWHFLALISSLHLNNHFYMFNKNIFSSTSIFLILLEEQEDAKSSAKRFEFISLFDCEFNVSLIKILNNTLLKTPPWGTPVSILYTKDKIWFIMTINVLSWKKQKSHLMIYVSNLNFFILYNNPNCQTLSKAFEISKKIVQFWCFLFKHSKFLWKIFKMLSFVWRYDLNPDCCLIIIWFSFKCFVISNKINLSPNLEIQLVIEIGR